VVKISRSVSADRWGVVEMFRAYDSSLSEAFFPTHFATDLWNGKTQQNQWQIVVPKNLDIGAARDSRACSLLRDGNRE